jgi:hypothetical protein
MERRFHHGSSDTRGARKILTRYADKMGLSRPVSPHKMGHFLFT